jgi:hypothetical protein
MNRRVVSRAIATALAALVLVLGSVAEAAPAFLTQQGRLLSTAGVPMTGTLSFVFTIYDAPTAGASLWTETQSITLDDGYFSAKLGQTTAIGAAVFDGTERYLGVKVGTDAEMTPREGVRSVPYALSANQVPFAGVTGLPAACTGANYSQGVGGACGAPVGAGAGLAAAVAGATTNLSVSFAGTGAATTAARSDHTHPLTCTERQSAVNNGVRGTSVSAAYQGCNAGETLTGGGCYTTGTLQRNFMSNCSGLCLCLVNTPCPPYQTWFCASAAAADTTYAYAMCCTL